MRERDSREEDKEEGRGLGEGSFFLGKIGEEEGKEEILKERGKKEEIGGHRLFWGDFTGALVVAGNFGLGGQETTRIPGAREPERLFLVGWEVNIQFGQFGQTRTNRKGAKSTNL
jgi:hypothetical protein